MTGQQSIKEWTDYPLSFFCKKRVQFLRLNLFYYIYICLDPRETCIDKGVERSYKGHFVA